MGLACVKDVLNGAITGECPFHPPSFLFRSKWKNKWDLGADRIGPVLGSLLTFALTISSVENVNSNIPPCLKAIYKYSLSNTCINLPLPQLFYNFEWTPGARYMEEWQIQKISTFRIQPLSVWVDSFHGKLQSEKTSKKYFILYPFCSCDLFICFSTNLYEILLSMAVSCKSPC